MNGSATSPDIVTPPREWGYLEATVLMTGLTLGFMAFQMAHPKPFGTMGVRGATVLIFYPLIMALAVGAFLSALPIVRFPAGVPFAGGIRREPFEP